MRQKLFVAALSLFTCVITNRAEQVFAIPLLAVDFGRVVENPVQSGFFEMTGTTSQATANASFGAYTVDLAGQGFADSNNGAAVDASVRPLYRDYYYNNSDVNGTKPGKMRVQVEAVRATQQRDPQTGTFLGEMYIPARYNRETVLEADIIREGKNTFEFDLTQ